MSRSSGRRWAIVLLNGLFILAACANVSAQDSRDSAPIKLDGVLKILTGPEERKDSDKGWSEWVVADLGGSISLRDQRNLIEMRHRASDGEGARRLFTWEFRNNSQQKAKVTFKYTYTKETESGRIQTFTKEESVVIEPGAVQLGGRVSDYNRRPEVTIMRVQVVD